MAVNAWMKRNLHLPFVALGAVAVTGLLLGCQPQDSLEFGRNPPPAPFDATVPRVVVAPGSGGTGGSVEDPGKGISDTPGGSTSVTGACKTYPLGGIGVPDGTVTTASATYPTTSMHAAVDGDLTNQWNSGSNSGWLRLAFPTPTAITGVHIAALSKPSVDETYTISADGLSVPIASVTRHVPTGGPALLAPIPVAPGTYASITIAIKSGTSWVGIADLSLLTSECPFVCSCTGRACGDDGCGTICGACPAGRTCSSGACN